MQRDLPASLTVNATYLGTKGTHLIQEFLPNTYPAGARESVPDVPGGFRLSHVGAAARRGMPARCRCAAGCATD